MSEIVIPAVTTTRRSEIDWLYRGVGRFFPEQWDRFRAGRPRGRRDGDLVAAYARLMEHPDPAVRAKAAIDWVRLGGRGDLHGAERHAERRTATARRPP